MRTTKGRWTTRIGVALLALIATDQIILHTALGDGVILGVRLAPYAPPLYTEEQRRFLAEFEAMLGAGRERFDARTLFDAELGWCPRPGGSWELAHFDALGSRIGAAPLPLALPEGERLIALLGCSFTFGSEVTDEETWGALLDRRWQDVRIGNFGVAGYGVDQMLLRYRRDVAPLAPDEVWLGLYPDVAIRASSQFPPLYYRWRGRTINFKPRFSLDERGELVLHPSPARVPEDIPRLLEDPRAFLEALDGHDPWIARIPAAYMPEGSNWTHYSTLGRLCLTVIERSGRSPAFLGDPESELYRLNRALVVELAREVRDDGSRFRLVFLPGRRELEEPRWLERVLTFVDDLRASGIEALDVSPFLEDRGSGRSDLWMPGGHYGPRGNELVAEAIDSAWGDRR